MASPTPTNQLATPPPPQPSSGASTSDILTALKNVVIAINNLAQNYLNINGVACTAPLSSTTLVKASSGRAVSISVLLAGSTTGRILNSNSISTLSNPLYIVENAIGIQQINLPAGNGIIFVPGTDMLAVVNYS